MCGWIPIHQKQDGCSVVVVSMLAIAASDSKLCDSLGVKSTQQHVYDWFKETQKRDWVATKQSAFPKSHPSGKPLGTADKTKRNDGRVLEMKKVNYSRELWVKMWRESERQECFREQTLSYRIKKKKKKILFICNIFPAVSRLWKKDLFLIPERNKVVLVSWGTNFKSMMLQPPECIPIYCTRQLPKHKGQLVKLLRRVRAALIHAHQ